ncbi:MAG: hypothetical protein Q4B65_00440 [Candidatus Saccharibacteria bacterium]|nr:hypothetical protein [Candidatus Saccharibacteria bacterium]
MNAFTVLPMSQAINLKAGEVYEGSITVANPADATENFEYLVSVSPYAVLDENYTADFSSESDWSQIVEWTTIEEPTGSLEPNEVRKVNFKITVPETAPAGGQYAAITVRSNKEVSEGSGVSVQNVFEMASIVFAQVEGETVHSGEVLENNIPGFSATNPVSISAKLNNSGNVHESAITSITVKNVLTGEQIFPSRDSGAEQYLEYIMPGTTRYLVREISGTADLGVYEVTQSISYIGETSSVTQRIIFCPIWFMVLAFMTVAALGWTIFKLIRRRKAKKAAL